jgi:putative transposase
LLIEYKPDICLSTLIANLKTVSSRLIRKENPTLAKKYFYGKAHFWTGSYFVASCGGVTIQQLKKYVENQETPKSVNPFLVEKSNGSPLDDIFKIAFIPPLTGRQGG